MQGSIIVRLIVTGITAMVPSDQDPNVTRLIALNHMEMTEHHSMIPEHFAFIEVHSRNLLPSNRKENFRYRLASEEDDRVVFIVSSEEIKFANAPTNRTLVRNHIMPKKGLLQPEGEKESTSTAYVLDMTAICPRCKSIDSDYFDIHAHHDKVALRMDLVGGRESTRNVTVKEVWHARGTKLKQPLTQEVVYEFDVPANEQRLLLTRVPFPGGAPRETSIDLHSCDGEPIEVTIGNGPLLSILKLDAHFKGEHKDDHFALFYDMFKPAPWRRRVLKLVPGKNDPVNGPKDNCIPPRLIRQDPRP